MSPPRKIRMIERRYVQEYVLQAFPGRVWAQWNVPIGPIPETLLRAHPDISLKTAKPWRSFADALVYDGKKLFLIEAKIHNLKRGVGDLDRYMSIIRETPELQRYKSTPIELRLVIPMDDPTTMAHAQQRQVVVAIYRPQWVIDYLKERGILA